MCSSQNNTGAIESWKMDWAGRMRAREDKMAQHIVYCLGSKNLFFLHGFLVQVCWHSHISSRNAPFSLAMSVSVCLSAVTGRIRVKFYVRVFY